MSMPSDFRKPKTTRSVLGRGLSSLISASPVSVIPGGNAAPAYVAEEPVLVIPAPQASSTQTVQAFVKAMASPTPNDVLISEPVEHEVRFLPIEKLIPNPGQPRQEFKESELNELKESIKSLGVLQPILVRPSAENYEIVAGERRWRAAKLAGLVQVPVLVKALDDKETLEIALVENIQRENLNPVEEALAYQRLMDELFLGQQEVADKVGKDRATVANVLRLLKLSPEVLDLVRKGQLSPGHAKAILAVKEPAAQLSLAKKTIAEQLSVRALEAVVSRVVVLDSGRRQAAKVETKPEDSNFFGTSFPVIVDRLRNTLGTKVIIKHHESGRGRVEIEYFSEAELDRVVEKICG